VRAAGDSCRVTLAEVELAAASFAALPAEGEPVLRVLVVLVWGRWATENVGGPCVTRSKPPPFD
jgi:hypothetical protein